jgi:RNA polymerase sigma factor (sigma-70 family)
MVPPRAADLLSHLQRLKDPPTSDRVLLERFAHFGDEFAFAGLVARHGLLVLRICRRVLADAHAAEDAFQATFLVLARRAGSIRRPESLAAFLHGVAIRVARKARAAAARRREENAPITPPIDPNPDPLGQVSAREVLIVLDEELSRLPEVYRLPLLLCCLEGLSQEEAARQLGWTAGSVKGRLERGRRLLHRRLARRGLTVTAALAAAELSRGASTAVGGTLATTAVSSAVAYATLQGGTITGLSAEAVALADGVLRGMLLSRWSLAVVLLLALGLATGAGIAFRPFGGAESSEPVPQPAQVAAAPPTTPQGDPLPDGAIARLGTLRLRGVRGCMAFSPDGKLLATTGGSAGERIILWDRAMGREVRRFGPHATIQTLAFSPDGLCLISSGNELRCRVWDVQRGQQLFTVPGSHGAFGAEGKTIISADRFGAGSKVHICDATTGRSLNKWPLENGASGLVAADDGRTFAVVDNADPFVVRIRDAQSGATLRTLRLETDASWKTALSPDGKTLATADANGVRLWDVATGNVLRTWKQRSDSRPVFSRDGKLIAWSGYNGIARVWVVPRDGDTPRAVGEPTNNFEAPCFAPDGKVLAVVTDAHAVQLRAVDTGKDLFPLEGHDNPVLGLAFTPDGGGLISRARNAILAWDLATGRLLRRSTGFEHGTEELVALLPDGRLLTADRTANPLEGVFLLRDVRTGREVLRFEGRPDVGPPCAVAAPGGRFAAVRGRAGEVCVLDLQAGRCIYRVDPQAAASGLRLSADGDVLVWHQKEAAGRAIHVRRHSTGKSLVLRGIPEDHQTDRWLADGLYVSPDARWLLLRTEGGKLRRWDLTTGKELDRLPEAQRTVWQLRWSPDGRFVAAGGSASPANVIDHEARRDVRLWDVASGKRLAQFDLAEMPQCMLFSNDSRTLLTTDLQGVIHLWEVVTGKERRRLTGHLAGEIAALALSSDGRTLASGGYDSQVLVWDLTGRAPDGRRHSSKLSPEQLKAAWHALAGDDAGKAFEALWALAEDAEGTTALLAERLRPVARPDPASVKKWIAELDHDDFATRQQAERELERLGEVVTAELREALRRAPSPEANRRLQRLVETLEQPVPRELLLQQLRAVEVLEYLGIPQANALLKTLAGGASGAWLTEAAQASLRRLRQRPAPP